MRRFVWSVEFLLAVLKRPFLLSWRALAARFGARTVMSVFSVFLVTSAVLVAVDNTATDAAELPVCQLVTSDPDGDGWGWENGATCEVTQVSAPVGSDEARQQEATTEAAIVEEQNSQSTNEAADSQTDDGQEAVSQAAANQSVTGSGSGAPDCSGNVDDPDGDGWGWENGASCRVPENPNPEGAVVPERIDHGQRFRDQALARLGRGSFDSFEPLIDSVEVVVDVAVASGGALARIDAELWRVQQNFDPLTSCPAQSMRLTELLGEEFERSYEATDGDVVGVDLANWLWRIVDGVDHLNGTLLAEADLCVEVDQQDSVVADDIDTSEAEVETDSKADGETDTVATDTTTATADDSPVDAEDEVEDAAEDEVVVVETRTAEDDTPVCSVEAVDNGDGWGWENNQSCKWPEDDLSDSDATSNDAPTDTSSEADGLAESSGTETVIADAESETDDAVANDAVADAESEADDAADVTATDDAVADDVADADSEAGDAADVTAADERWPICSASAVDDGNGWGWENNQTCQWLDDQLDVETPGAVESDIDVVIPDSVEDPAGNVEGDQDGGSVESGGTDSGGDVPTLTLGPGDHPYCVDDTSGAGRADRQFGWEQGVSCLAEIAPNILGPPCNVEVWNEFTYGEVGGAPCVVSQAEPSSPAEAAKIENANLNTGASPGGQEFTVAPQAANFSSPTDVGGTVTTGTSTGETASPAGEQDPSADTADTADTAAVDSSAGEVVIAAPGDKPICMQHFNFEENVAERGLSCLAINFSPNAAGLVCTVSAWRDLRFEQGKQGGRWCDVRQGATVADSDSAALEVTADMPVCVYLRADPAEVDREQGMNCLATPFVPRGADLAPCSNLAWFDAGFDRGQEGQRWCIVRSVEAIQAIENDISDPSLAYSGTGFRDAVVAEVGAEQAAAFGESIVVMSGAVHLWWELAFNRPNYDSFREITFGELFRSLGDRTVCEAHAIAVANKAQQPVFDAWITLRSNSTASRPSNDLDLTYAEFITKFAPGFSSLISGVDAEGKLTESQELCNGTPPSEGFVCEPWSTSCLPDSSEEGSRIPWTELQEGILDDDGSIAGGWEFRDAVAAELGEQTNRYGEIIGVLTNRLASGMESIRCCGAAGETFRDFTVCNAQAAAIETSFFELLEQTYGQPHVSRSQQLANAFVATARNLDENNLFIRFREQCAGFGTDDTSDASIPTDLEIGTDADWAVVGTQFRNGVVHQLGDRALDFSAEILWMAQAIHDYTEAADSAERQRLHSTYQVNRGVMFVYATTCGVQLMVIRQALITDGVLALAEQGQSKADIVGALIPTFVEIVSQVDNYGMLTYGRENCGTAGSDAGISVGSASDGSRQGAIARDYVLEALASYGDIDSFRPVVEGSAQLASVVTAAPTTAYLEARLEESLADLRSALGPVTLCPDQAMALSQDLAGLAAYVSTMETQSNSVEFGNSGFEVDSSKPNLIGSFVAEAVDAWLRVRGASREDLSGPRVYIFSKQEVCDGSDGSQIGIDYGNLEAGNCPAAGTPEQGSLAWQQQSEVPLNSPCFQESVYGAFTPSEYLELALIPIAGTPRTDEEITAQLQRDVREMAIKSAAAQRQGNDVSDNLVDEIADLSIAVALGHLGYDNRLSNPQNGFHRLKSVIALVPEELPSNATPFTHALATASTYERLVFLDINPGDWGSAIGAYENALELREVARDIRKANSPWRKILAIGIGIAAFLIFQHLGAYIWTWAVGALGLTASTTMGAVALSLGGTFFAGAMGALGAALASGKSFSEALSEAGEGGTEAVVRELIGLPDLDFPQMVGIALLAGAIEDMNGGEFRDGFNETFLELGLEALGLNAFGDGTIAEQFTYQLVGAIARNGSDWDATFADLGQWALQLGLETYFTPDALVNEDGHIVYDEFGDAMPGEIPATLQLGIDTVVVVAFHLDDPAAIDKYMNTVFLPRLGGILGARLAEYLAGSDFANRLLTYAGTAAGTALGRGGSFEDMLAGFQLEMEKFAFTEAGRFANDRLSSSLSDNGLPNHRADAIGEYVEGIISRLWDLDAALAWAEGRGLLILATDLFRPDETGCQTQNDLVANSIQNTVLNDLADGDIDNAPELMYDWATNVYPTIDLENAPESCEGVDGGACAPVPSGGPAAGGATSASCGIGNGNGNPDCGSNSSNITTSTASDVVTMPSGFGGRSFGRSAVRLLQVQGSDEIPCANAELFVEELHLVTAGRFDELVTVVSESLADGTEPVEYVSFRSDLTTVQTGQILGVGFEDFRLVVVDGRDSGVVESRQGSAGWVTTAVQTGVGRDSAGNIESFGSVDAGSLYQAVTAEESAAIEDFKNWLRGLTDDGNGLNAYFVESVTGTNIPGWAVQRTAFIPISATHDGLMVSVPVSGDRSVGFIHVRRGQDWSQPVSGQQVAVSWSGDRITRFGTQNADNIGDHLGQLQPGQIDTEVRLTAPNGVELLWHGAYPNQRVLVADGYGVVQYQEQWLGSDWSPSDHMVKIDSQGSRITNFTYLGSNTGSVNQDLFAVFLQNSLRLLTGGGSWSEVGHLITGCASAVKKAWDEIVKTLSDLPQALQDLIAGLKAMDAQLSNSPNDFLNTVIAGVLSEDDLARLKAEHGVDNGTTQWTGQLVCSVLLAAAFGAVTGMVTVAIAGKILNGALGRPNGDSDSNNSDVDGPVCGTNSFPTGTLVRMGDGSLRPIELIDAGEFVLAGDPVSGVFSSERVLSQWSHPDDGVMATVSLVDGSRVSATDHHEFWVASDGAWLELDQVESGDYLLTPDGVVEVASVLLAAPAETLVWELDTDGPDTFTVHTGTSDVLVHNADCGVPGFPGWTFQKTNVTTPKGVELTAKETSSGYLGDVLKAVWRDNNSTSKPVRSIKGLTLTSRSGDDGYFDLIGLDDGVKQGSSWEQAFATKTEIGKWANDVGESTNRQFFAHIKGRKTNDAGETVELEFDLSKDRPDEPFRLVAESPGVMLSLLDGLSARMAVLRGERFMLDASRFDGSSIPTRNQIDGFNTTLESWKARSTPPTVDELKPLETRGNSLVAALESLPTLTRLTSTSDAGEHLFVPRVKSDGTVDGLHHLGDIDPDKFVVTVRNRNDFAWGRHTAYEGRVTVLDREKGISGSAYKTLFPDEMTSAEVVRIINEALNNAKFLETRPASPNRHTLSGRSTDGYNVKMTVEVSGRTATLVTAYPIP